MLALYGSSLMISPLVVSSYSDKGWIEAVFSAVSPWCTLIGGWIAAMYILPLDWMRWWLKWPIPLVFGAYYGKLVGLILEPVVFATVAAFTSNSEKKLY